MVATKYYPPMSIAEYQEFIRSRYEEFDRKVSVNMLVLRLHEEATELVSPIHEASRNWQRASQNVVNSLADIVPWLCAICSSVGISLDSAMEWKYGKNCPICGYMPCRCRPPQPAISRPPPPDELFVQPPPLPPKNRRHLDTWQSHLHEMYKDNLELDISVLPLRLLEDIGSMGKAIRIKRSFPSDKDWKADVAWKAASVVAWSLAICNFFNDSKNTNLHLHQIIFEKYASDFLPQKTLKESEQFSWLRCPKCGHEWKTLQA